MPRKSFKPNYLIDIPGEDSDEDDDEMGDMEQVFFGHSSKKTKIDNISTNKSPQQSQQSQQSLSPAAAAAGNLPSSTRSQHSSQQSSSTHKENNKKETILVDIDDDDDNQTSPLKSSSHSKHVNQSDAIMNDAKDLLKKLANSKSRVTDIYEIEDEPVVSSKIIVPKVRSAEERSKLNALTASAATSRFKDFLQVDWNEDSDNIRSSAQNNQSSSSSSSATPALIIDYNKPRIKLKFRVNGKISLACSLPKSLNFANIRASFQELMTSVTDASISSASPININFVFDGEAVSGDDTSEDLDLDDDMMIDMKVNKDIFDSITQNIAANVTRIKLSTSQVNVLSVASRNQFLLLECSDGRVNSVLRTR